jgi:hypothetical protein
MGMPAKQSLGKILFCWKNASAECHHMRSLYLRMDIEEKRAKERDRG